MTTHKWTSFSGCEMTAREMKADRREREWRKWRLTRRYQINYWFFTLTIMPFYMLLKYVWNGNSRNHSVFLAGALPTLTQFYA